MSGGRSWRRREMRTVELGWTLFFPVLPDAQGAGVLIDKVLVMSVSECLALFGRL